MMIGSIPGRLVSVALLAALVLGGCSWSGSGDSPGTPSAKPLRIGYVGSPMVAPLYLAEAGQEKWSSDHPLELLQFRTSADAGYALLSGALHAALIEPSKTSNLLQEGNPAGLKIAGAIQFPYGATLVLRKDLSMRLGDLVGRKVAAEGDDCALFHQFTKDARRLGADLKGIKMVFMPFEDMIPALEAKMVDAILTKGSYGVIGESLGHKVLYQKWDLEAGADQCCPAILAQTVYFLVVRRMEDGIIAGLVHKLEKTNQIKPADARRLVSKRIGISEEQLAQFPVASFNPVMDQLRSLLKEQAWNPKQ